jgi:KaiC/GvpD/RAD55 family RecA-like ATPase
MKKEAPARNDRTPSGIPGFDELIQGGFPKKSSTLICGGPGTGKTIFSMEYVVNGALKYGEKGLYVTFEQRIEDLEKQASQFKWDLNKLQKSGMVEIMYVPVTKIDANLIEKIKEKVIKNKIKRLVVDSLTTLVINAPIYQRNSDLSIKEIIGENIMFSPPIIGDYIFRRFLYGFIEELRSLDCTVLLLGEADQSGENISRDSLSEFACDGVVVISFESMGGDYSRSLIVRKMRSTKNNGDTHSFDINDRGIVIKKIK